jgi:hypothetical protein
MLVPEASRAANLLWPEFIELGGCIFALPAVSRAVRSDWRKNPNGERPWQDMDRTGAEALENHVRVLDCFEHGDVWNSARATYRTSHPHFKAAERFGKIMAESWFAKLSRDYPQDHFRVYYTRNDNPIVRFHRVYPGEPAWLDEAGREEDVKRQHLLVLDTRERY